MKRMSNIIILTCLILSGCGRKKTEESVVKLFESGVTDISNGHIYLLNEEHVTTQIVHKKLEDDFFICD